MAEPTLEALIAQVARGERAAVEAVYRRTSGKLLGVILAIVGNRATAEEVLQEAFVTIWRKAPQYEARRGQAIAWLVTIARSQAIDAVRAASRRPRLDDAIDPAAFEAAGPSPDELAIRIGDARALARCLEELGEAQRLCIRLAYWRGYTHAELAELLERPIGTIKSWTRRGVMNLKECLTR